MLTILWLVLVPTTAVVILIADVESSRNYYQWSHERWVRHLESVRAIPIPDSRLVNEHQALQRALLDAQQEVTDAANELARAQSRFYFLTYITPSNVLGFLAFAVLPPALLYVIGLIAAWIVRGFKPAP